MQTGEPPARATEPDAAGGVARFALALTSWTERWVPDAFVFALVATLVVVVAGVAATPSTLGQVVDAWGRGFWDLIPFTLQMAMVIITGHVLATSRPMRRLIRSSQVAFDAAGRGGAGDLLRAGELVAELGLQPGVQRGAGARGRAPRRGGRLPRARGRELSRARQRLGAGPQRLRRAADGHAGRASAGRSATSSPAAASCPAASLPSRHTIFLWQSLRLGRHRDRRRDDGDVAGDAAGGPGKNRAASSASISDEAEVAEPPAPRTICARAPWLEHSPILTWLIVALGVAYLVRYFAGGRAAQRAQPQHRQPDLPADGFLLHGTPARLMHAVQAATPAVWGVILQFPFYAGIAGDDHLHAPQRAAREPVRPRLHADTFPPLVAIYSAVLGVFVPSGGSKWVIEAPYVMAAAHELQVHLGWVVAAYDLGEALANLVQPFWMLPMLGLFQLRARDVMGYTLVVFWCCCRRSSSWSRCSVERCPTLSKSG